MLVMVYSPAKLVNQQHRTRREAGRRKEDTLARFQKRALPGRPAKPGKQLNRKAWEKQGMVARGPWPEGSLGGVAKALSGHQKQAYPRASSCQSADLCMPPLTTATVKLGKRNNI